MKVTLKAGRIEVSCPSCEVRVRVGAPRHKVTIGHVTGVTVTPAAVCPECYGVFDIRRDIVRPLGKYSLPPQHLAFLPDTRDEDAPTQVVKQPRSPIQDTPQGYTGEPEPEPEPASTLESVDDDSGDEQADHNDGAHMDTEQPDEVAEESLTPDSEPEPDSEEEPRAVIHPKDYTKVELQAMCEAEGLPTDGTKASLAHSLNSLE